MSKRWSWGPRSLLVKFNHFYILNIRNWNIDFPRWSAFLSLSRSPSPETAESSLDIFQHCTRHIIFTPASISLSNATFPVLWSWMWSVIPSPRFLVYRVSFILYSPFAHFHILVVGLLSVLSFLVCVSMLANLSKWIKQKRGMGGEKGEDAKWSVRRFRAREARQGETVLSCVYKHAHTCACHTLDTFY
jgi:hypothetical protein